MNATSRGYDRVYKRKLAGLLAGEPVVCVHCRKRQATTLDHDPPLGMHAHRPNTGCCRLLPSCEQCNRRGGTMVANGSWRPGVALAELDADRERDGLGADHRCWRVSWLRELRKVPRDAVWPRLMTAPHPRAVGTLGPEFCAWAEARTGRPLRWWQQLVAYRVLEVDAAGRLVWETAILTTARQVGKSYLLREFCLWRIQQGERFGEPQDVLHTGKDLAVCKEVQRPARIWAKARHDDYRVREVNGQEEIERLEDGSRWMLRAKEAVYGYSVSLGVVDEAWRVRASSIDEGLTPTMAEREQPQLLLVSTAHRKATALVLERRKVALDALELGDGDLLIEWSAPRDAAPEDREAWRLASPTWSPRRERLIGKAHDRMLAGELDDPDEPDPVASFRAQWLNQWPIVKADPSGPTEPLLPEGVWAGLAESELEPNGGGVWVALEDDFGLGAAVACARRLADGRLEVDGWLRGDWDSAVADVERLREAFAIRRLLVGASMLDRMPAALRSSAEARTATSVRAGLALLRDLAIGGQLAHDVTTAELDAAVGVAMVREAPTGLMLISKGPVHLVKALVWALAAAHRPVKAPAVH